MLFEDADTERHNLYVPLAATTKPGVHCTAWHQSPLKSIIPMQQAVLMRHNYRNLKRSFIGRKPIIMSAFSSASSSALQQLFLHDNGD